MKRPREIILSRHRLPQRYRFSLAALWLFPGVLLLGVLVFRWGWSPSLIDPRLLLPLALMLLPSVCIWREGIDVLPSGIIRRSHMTQYYPYSQLATWHLDRRENFRTLTIWNLQRRKVIECHTGHLTDLHLLLHALSTNVRSGPWQY